jgi:hypothetical protein
MIMTIYIYIQTEAELEQQSSGFYVCIDLESYSYTSMDSV